MVLDEADAALDEPNFNNFNTSPEPPSPYADLEKKYRKNKFNKTRKTATPTGLFGTHGLVPPVSGTKPAGKKFQKKRAKNAAVAPKPLKASN